MSDRVAMYDGDADRIKRILSTGDAADALAEVMRSRGALLDFVLKVDAAKDVPEWLRAAVRAALKDAPIRDISAT